MNGRNYIIYRKSNGRWKHGGSGCLATRSKRGRILVLTTKFYATKTHLIILRGDPFSRANAAKSAGVGAAILFLDAAANALDKANSNLDDKKFQQAYSLCEQKAAMSGVSEGCGCCVIGVIRKWSQAARGPTLLDGLIGRTMGYGPSGESIIWSVTGTFKNSPCDEVYDPGVLLDWSSTIREFQDLILRMPQTHENLDRNHPDEPMFGFGPDLPD